MAVTSADDSAIPLATETVEVFSAKIIYDNKIVSIRTVFLRVYESIYIYSLFRPGRG